MDLMKNSYSDEKYHQYKIRIKLWESNFVDKHERKPNKNDIKEADNSIREAYKIYWALKNKSLRETLKEDDINKPEDSTSVEGSCLDPILSETQTSFNKEQVLPVLNSINSKNTDANNHELNAISCSTLLKNKQNKKTVWGHHLNVKKDCKKSKSDDKVDGNTSFQLSQKMFKSLDFSKRNPKKSASHTKLEIDNNTENSDQFSNEINLYNENNADASNMSECTKPNFKIISLKNKLSCTSSNTFQQLIYEPSKIHTRPLNEDWLNRCSQMDIYGNCDIKEENIKKSTNSVVHNYEISDDCVFNSDSDDDYISKRKRNYDEICDDKDIQNAKRLCSENNLSDTNNVKVTDRHSYDSKEDNKLLESVNDTINVTNKDNVINKNLSSISVNISSSNQIQSDIKSSTKSDEVHSVDDILSTEFSDIVPQVTPSNPSSSLTASDDMFKDETVKNRKKSVKKRSAKDLNTNYIKINLKKKVFSRGKKAFNLSSYKKAEWKKRNQRYK